MQLYSRPSGPGPSTLQEFPLTSHEKESRVPRHPASTHSASRCACRGVVLRVMPPRPPDDQLRRPRRRVRSPSHEASKVDVIVGPERTRHIVTHHVGDNVTIQRYAWYDAVDFEISSSD